MFIHGKICQILRLNVAFALFSWPVIEYMLIHGEIGQILRLNVVFAPFLWLVAELVSYVLIHGKVGSASCVSNCMCSFSISLDQFECVSCYVLSLSLSHVFTQVCTVAYSTRSHMVFTPYG